MHANLMARSALTFLVMAIAAPAWAQADKFVPHMNAPGPSRLDMEKADNSGAVNTDIQFIADRLAIINHISAYAYLLDEGRWEDWFALFSDDVSFEVTAPTFGTIIIKGQKPFRAFVENRYIKPAMTSTAVRRHIMGNIHVASQTATAARARSYMLISSVTSGNRLNPLTTGTYNINLEKRDGKWTITRWYTEADGLLAPGKLPQGFTDAEVTFIPYPQARARCHGRFC
jgi:SnoaL-like domain